jgi:hypothetical protein
MRCLRRGRHRFSATFASTAGWDAAPLLGPETLRRLTQAGAAAALAGDTEAGTAFTGVACLATALAFFFANFLCADFTFRPRIALFVVWLRFPDMGIPFVAAITWRHCCGRYLREFRSLDSRSASRSVTAQGYDAPRVATSQRESRNDEADVRRICRPSQLIGATPRK